MSISKVWYYRQGDSLIATDQDALKLLRKLEEGEAIAFKPLRPRSLSWHRRYWLLISRLAEQLTEFNISLGEVPAMLPIASPYDLHTAIKMVTGHCVTQHIKGTPYVLRIPKPTDFESMTADEWSTYYPRVLDAIHQRALPQIGDRYLEDELARLAS